MTKRMLLLAALVAAFLMPAQAAQDDVVLFQGDINIASSGDNTVVSGASGVVLCVYKMWFVTTAAVNVKFEDGTTAFNAGAIHFTGDGSSLYFPFDGKPYFCTTRGNAFTMNLSGAQQVSGQVYYAKR